MKKVEYSILYIFVILTLLFISCVSNGKSSEDFTKFIKKFYNDEEFQMSRIDFPIAGKVQEDGRIQIIEKEDWVILKPIDESNPDYKITTGKITEDLFRQQIVVKNTFSIDLEFTLNPTTNKWYLSTYSGISSVSLKAEVDPLVQDSSRSVRFVHPDSLKNE